MTAKQVMEQGPRFGKKGATGARRGYYDFDTVARWAMLQWTLEARRLNLRTANRRWRRRNGLSLRNA